MPEKKKKAHNRALNTPLGQYYGVTSNSTKSRPYDSHQGAFFSQCIDRTHITAVGEVAARPGAGVKLGLTRT